MATQIIITVPKADNDLFPQAFRKSFETDNILVRRESIPSLSVVASVLYMGKRYYCTESVETIVTAAAGAIIQATVNQVDNTPYSAVAHGFPSTGINIRSVTDKGATINAAIQYSGQLYYVLETIDDLHGAANTGVGDGGTVATSTELNAGTDNAKFASSAALTGSAFAAAPADYTIDKIGSTITARPRIGSGLSQLSGTDAYTVIQGAINALTPAGAQGTGGGDIYIGPGTFALTNELTIVGWESSNPPFAQLRIKGVGYATRIVQNTSGKNAFVVKNRASVDICNIWIGMGSSALSGILLDDSGTSEISVFKGTIDNVMIISSSTGAPAFLGKNFFDLNVPHLWAENTGNDAIRLVNTTTNSTNYGNSHFGIINAVAKSTTPYACFAIISDVSNHPMNLIQVDALYCASGFYGLYCRGAGSNTLNFVDIENIANPVYLADGASGVENYNNVILSGLLLANTGSALIYCSQKSAGNVFNDIRLEGDGGAIITDIQEFRQANSYRLFFGYGYGATPTINITSASETPLIYKKAYDGLTVIGGKMASLFNAKASLAGATFTGPVIHPASATGSAPIRIPHGTAPTSPVNGDMWTTSAGIFVRINGVTKTITIT